MTADMEDRLARLEELCYFQETALQELNDALLQQQTQVDSLEKTLAVADAKIAALQEQLDEGPVNSLPPHFMPERY